MYPASLDHTLKQGTDQEVTTMSKSNWESATTRLHNQTSLQGSCSLNIEIGLETQGNPYGEQPGTIPMMGEGPILSLGQGSAVNPRERTCQCQTAQAAVKHELHVPKAKLESRCIPWDPGMHASVLTRQAQVMLSICTGRGSPCSVTVLTLVEYRERLGIPIQQRHL